MGNGCGQAQTPQRTLLRAAAPQVAAELAARDREQPGAHLLPAVGAHARPPEPGLGEGLGGQFQSDLAVQRTPRQEHQHRLRLISIEGDESLGISHHS